MPETLDIGLRYRFFLVILSSLILAAFAINLVHSSFFKSQRIKLIDRQIAASSAILLESKKFQSNLKSRDAQLDEVISSVLGGSRIGKLFILRGPRGKILFQSFNFGLLNIEIPQSPDWVTVETDEQYVRVKNAPIPNDPTLTLQVGLVLDRNFINWKIVDRTVIYLIVSIVTLLFAIAVLVTLFLLSPLRNLISHLNQATSNLTYQKKILPLPERLREYKSGLWSKSDEFAVLLLSVQKLIDRINLNYKLTRFWTSQMAHGLKTPLAILRAETESKSQAGQIPTEFKNDVYKEIGQMSKIIDQFLAWAELESSIVQKDLHALRMRSVVQGVIARLDKLNPGRILLKATSDFAVLANPVHLDQVVTNLVTNALKFSGRDEEIEISISDNTFTVRDRGPGIPQEVKERIGEPFNIGPSGEESPTGNGLGLAMVTTVARLYQWRFEIGDVDHGTKACVEFPRELI